VSQNPSSAKHAIEKKEVIVMQESGALSAYGSMIRHMQQKGTLRPCLASCESFLKRYFGRGKVHTDLSHRECSMLGIS